MAETPTIAGAYTFDPFARHQFYNIVNTSLVRHAIDRLDADRPAGAEVRIVDLAAGTGAISELILDALDARGRRGTVIAVEPSYEAIDVARERLRGRSVEFVQGDSSDLARVAPNVDAVFFCNAIHLIDNKDAAIEDVARALGPRGFFACNSSFYDGAYAAGTERFYHLWTRRALGWLRKNHPDVRPSRSEKTMAMRWLSPSEYTALLARHGLNVLIDDEEVALMPLQAWQDIGRYWLFIDGALPGVPIPLGADALEYGAAQAFEELQLTDVPRVWLQIVAQKA